MSQAANCDYICRRLGLTPASGTDLQIATMEYLCKAIDMSNGGKTNYGGSLEATQHIADKYAVDEIINRWPPVFVAVGNGSGGNVAWSVDGTSWTKVQVGSNLEFRGVDWNPITRTYMIISRYGDFCYKSTDGKNWTPETRPFISSNNVNVDNLVCCFIPDPRDPRQSLTRWIAYAFNSLAYSDDDGRTWTEKYNIPFLTSNPGAVFNPTDGLYYFGGLNYFDPTSLSNAYGSNIIGNNIVPSGIVDYGINYNLNPIGGVSYVNKRIIIYGSNACVAYTDIGADARQNVWRLMKITGGHNPRSMAYGKGIYGAAGNEWLYTQDQPGNPAMLGNFTAVNTYVGANYSNSLCDLKVVVFGLGRFVMAGHNRSGIQGQAYYSMDGYNLIPAPGCIEEAWAIKGRN